MSSRGIARVACVALVAAGCLGTTPEEEAEQALGDDRGDEGPTHRPGQPCLVCHGEAYHPGDELFVLAGTVYRRAGDDVGLRGAEVEVIADDGETFTVRTNRAGNFLVSVGEVDRDRLDDGWLGLARAPVFPLRVAVRADGVEQRMRNVIHREGSCAHCHDRAGPGAASAGDVFVEEAP
jgi:hypothetical protein